MSREQIVALDALLVEVSTDSIKPAVRIHTWHTWHGTCGSRPARSRPAWTCRNTATARCSRRWSTRWRIATIRCAAAGSACRCSKTAWRSLEIRSPGSLPNNLTVDSTATRQAARNQTLTSMLGRMPVEGIRGSEDRRYFMERRGDGVPIILRETRGLCGRPPEYRVIDEAEVRLVIPAAPQEHSPARAVVNVRSADAGEPLAGVDVLALFPNDTWKRATTDEHGEAILDLHSSHLPMTVFAAATGFSARVRHDWMPAEGRLALALDILPGGGAILIPEDTGTLPGLRGRLNPIRDALDRTWLYASNIAVNQGQSQPVHFIPGEDLRLTDADGNERVGAHRRRHGPVVAGGVSPGGGEAGRSEARQGGVKQGRAE